MVRKGLCLIAVGLIAACQPATRGGMLDSPTLALTGVYSSQQVISDHPHHVLVGHVIIAERGGEVARALVIHQRRDGVHRLSFREAWSGGVAVPFRSTSRSGRGCTHGHCRDNQIGMILLDPAAFDRALQEGLAARLVGASGAIDIVAPPALFADAAERATET